uniref:RBR-type E3 ubiquitin transferase n=2 Tax=Knipowitschia caucasica TaxID=637954 RepID=A0AAV2KEA2_KNICA
MEDEGPVDDQSTMPSFISSFEDGRAKLSRNLSAETSFSDGKVERAVVDLRGRVALSDSHLSSVDVDGNMDENDAEGNNNNNCNSGSGGGGQKRRASAVEIILRRNFGTVSKSPSLCLNVCTRTPCAPEDDSRNITAAREEKKSSLETEAPVVNNERTSNLSHRLSTEQDDAEAQLCRVCLESKTIVPLSCCGMAVCEECLKLYVSSQVRMAKPFVSCPSPDCSGFLDEDLLLSLLTSAEAARYRYFLELSQLDSSTKPCPQCNHFTSLKDHAPCSSENKYKILCDSCQFLWCFKCHAPWHDGLKCREYRKGDKLLRSWANVIQHGQRNAQKCPQCKIHIQRTEGCDHMTCAQCNTNFCYRCGERYRHLRFFGDHTSNLSVFGCKYRYLPGKPHLRRFVRGSVCASKILMAPAVIVLVVVFGALALIIGLVVFPIYYVCKKQKKQHSQGSGRWI